MCVIFSNKTYILTPKSLDSCISRCNNNTVLIIIRYIVVLTKLRPTINKFDTNQKFKAEKTHEHFFMACSS